MIFRMILAERKIAVTCLCEPTAERCRDYQAAFGDPEIRIRISREDLDREREYFGVGGNPAESADPASWKDEDLEWTALHRKVIHALLPYDILMFHAAAVAAEKRCYLFLAESGTGKTTHARHWLNRIPGSFVLNGDKPLVNVSGKTVYGTPWCGKEKMNVNTAVPLAGLIRLERGPVNTIIPGSFREMWRLMLPLCHIPGETELRMKAVKLFGGLQEVPCYRLFCNQEEEAALVAWNGLRNR